jgi:hypothetical protein
MTVKKSFVPAGRSAALAAIAAIAIGFAGAASAQQPAQGAQKSMQPPATVYEDANSGDQYVLERRGKEVYAKLPSGEVVALDAIPAQRGDTYLRNDAGIDLFKLTESGALVSYVGNTNGAPAAVTGSAPSLSAPPVPTSLDQKRKAAAAALSKLAGREVTVFLGELGNYQAWAAEALDIAVRGVEEASGPAGRGATKLKAVRLERAKSATVSFKDGDLVLGVNPDEGYSGRPSSDAIAKAITQARSTG